MSDAGSMPPPPPPPPGEGDGPGQGPGQAPGQGPGHAPGQGPGHAPGQGPGQYPGMQGMPSYESAPPAAAVARPASIAQAVKLMYVGAALSVLGILVTVLMKGAIRDAVEKASQNQSTPMTPSQVDAAVNLGVVFAVITGIIGVALWLWMASANGKGRKWARVVATVLFVLSVLSTLSSLLQHPPALALVLNLVMLALGAYILYLLYRPESTQYYEAQSAPRI